MNLVQKFNVLVLFAGLVLSSCLKTQAQELPNILWLVSEDNSAYFSGCYGNSFATTPNMDKLASEGFRYTHAFCNAPVCAPARNTIISGVYACSGGNEQMRSLYKKSNVIRLFPEFLRAKGYYCTNNNKEDYNISLDQTKGVWDESSNSATYKNRKPDQPFFAVFNSGISHESCVHKSIPNQELRHDPGKVKLPPYHPNTPEMRHDWAQYYDKVEDMDTWLGQKLKELDDAGLSDNTIVFYYGDNGGVLGRSKRYVYETGTRIPLIVRIPEKYQHLFPAENKGDSVDRLISFVDLAPTILSICNIPVPEWMQGHAFLGPSKTPDPEYAFMFRGRMDERYDMCRAVRDKKYRYIRNYNPYRIYGQHIEYLWRAPSVGSWEQAYLEGKCDSTQSAFWNTKPAEELYDTENDPWEVHNLALNPDYKEILERMRKANRGWIAEIRDAGFIPEAELSRLAGNQPFYDYLRSGKVPHNAIVDAAELASKANAKDLNTLTKYLSNKNSVIRYWGASGLLMLKDVAKPVIPQLKSAVNDVAPDVSIIASEALYYLGEKETAINGLLAALKQPDMFARVRALNAIDYSNEFNPKIEQAILDMIEQFKDDDSKNRYDLFVVEWIFGKNGIKYKYQFESKKNIKRS